MLIWHEYFNIIWQKEQRYDPVKKHLNFGVTTFSSGFFNDRFMKWDGPKQDRNWIYQSGRRSYLIVATMEHWN